MRIITKLGILMFFGGIITIIIMGIILIAAMALTAPYPFNLFLLAALITLIGMIIMTIMKTIDPSA